MTRTRTTGHLFAGIDGFGLGLGVHGDAFRTAWTIELADFPHSILKLREPHAEHLRNVLEVTNPPRVEVLVGGFPCQDLALPGKGAGITGARSGLWGQYARIIGEVEPELVLIENVPALLHRGFELVVRDLVELGYRVEWDCLPAAAFGAPHLRDRVWIAAHRHDQPVIFGQPAALFPMLPEGAADLVGADGDDDGAASSWHRWPRAGWVDGDPELVMPLEPLARLSAVKSGAIRLWPTPTYSDGLYGAGSRTRNASLGTAVNLEEDRRQADGGRWPTPASMDATSGHTGRAETRGRHSLALHHLANNGVLEDAEDADDAIARLDARRWPTPKASPSGPDFARAGRDGSGGDDLATAVARTLRPDSYRTPRASEGEHPGRVASDHGYQLGTAESANAAQQREGKPVGALNPVWVEWLMGFPLGWTDPAVATADVVAAPWHLGEPGGVPRVVANLPRRADRLTALGNALVPAAPAWLGARYLDAVDPRSHTR